MNNKILVRRTNSLVRVWRSMGEPGIPLICTWVQADAAKLRPSSTNSSSDERGGRCLCA
jgi:hypothetical protein